MPSIMSRAAYDKRLCRRQIRSVGKPSPGKRAMIEFESLSEDVKMLIRARVGGDVYKVVKRSMLENYLVENVEMRNYFAGYLLPDVHNLKGCATRNLPTELQMEYSLQANVFDAIQRYINAKRSNRAVLGGQSFNVWDFIFEGVNQLPEKYDSLKLNVRWLQNKYHRYINIGPSTLVNGRFGNQYSCKVTEGLARLICSLHGDSKIPFVERTAELYLQFLRNEIDIVDTATGEVFDRRLFVDKKGESLVVSVSTVWNIVQDPRNAQFLKKLRQSSIDYRTQNSAYSHRHRPNFGMSKISMDDRDLSRKTVEGGRVHVYLAVDLASEVVLCSVYSRENPTVEMIKECFRAMYSFIVINGLPWAGECEVENHLMSELRGELDRMFAIVTFCNPQNSKEKGAEHVIRQLKYCTEKSNHEGIGRWHGKGNYKTKSENKDEDYKQPRLPYDTIVADAIADIIEHNNKPHSRIAGKTRLQVLKENANPDLQPPVAYKILKEIGKRTETSVRNYDSFRLQYEDYALATPEDSLARLEPNNYTVQAYWNEREDGTIPEAYIYQGDVYIGRATRYERYNEAKIERTAKDTEIKLEHQKRQAHQRKVVKDRMAAVYSKVAVIKNNVDYSAVVGKKASAIVADCELEITNYEPPERGVSVGQMAIDSI